MEAYESQIPGAHALFLSRALPILKADTRLLGVLAAGSWISGELDAFSDLDLVLVVQESAWDDVNRGRLALAESLGTLLGAFTGEHVGEPRLIVCLYDEPLLHVDLKFIPLTSLGERIEDPVVLWERQGALSRALRESAPRTEAPDLQWIEDRFWIWIHYAGTKLGRGELFELLDFLAFVRGRVLGPLALWLEGHPPRGVRRLESRLPTLVSAFARTVGCPDGASCRVALEATVRLYRDLRDKAASPALVRRSAAESAAVAYIAALPPT